MTPRRTLAIVALLLAACTTPPPSDATSGGVVAAATPEAAAAGAAILEAGGNAVDAMVAVQFALAVTEPAMSGLGGQTQVLMMAPHGSPVVLNGTSFAPSTLPERVTRDDLRGHRETTIPTTVRVLDYAWREHGSGTMAWADLLAPAIRWAEDGFPVGAYREKVWRRHLEDLRADSAAAGLFLVDGDLPPSGAPFRQPVLAATLRQLAERGADDFYTGEIAARIAEDMRQRGGWISAADLAGIGEPVALTPLHTMYRGHDVYSLPPPGGGWVVLQTLNLLEAVPASELGPDAAARPVHLARTLRIAHRSRRLDPVTDLVDFAAEAQRRTSQATADSLLRSEDRGETTHFTVVDGDGLVVSATASINAYFGSRSATPSLGFLYNSYMDEFELDAPDHPFALRGGGMPYSSMSPTIVASRGRPVLGLGSPGSARIMSTVAQLTQLWIDADLPIGQVVATPRVHVVGEERVYLESTPGPAVLAALTDLGLVREEPSTDLMVGTLNAYFGGVHAVAWREGGWTGAADPRRDGAVTRAGR